MERNKFYAILEYFLLYLFFGTVLLFQYRGSYNSTERLLFISLLLSYLWITGLFVYARAKHDLKLFEPITIITMIYEGIFIIKPIIDLNAGEIIEHGISVVGGGFKANVFFVIGYTIFFYSYYGKHVRFVYGGNPIITQRNVKWTWTQKRLLWLYIFWFITFGMCILCMISEGLSLRYIFTLGRSGAFSSDESNTALLFLSNFGITLVTLWLLIWEYSSNRTIKIITTVLSVIYILMRNARWLMLAFILAPITLHYLKKGKDPKTYRVVFFSILGLTIFAWMQANRYILHGGGAMQGFGEGGFTLEKLIAPLESDLSTYRTFYSMVHRYPSKYPYLLGKTFLYAFILFVPRAIWAGKPDNPVREMIEHALNKNARKSGTAVANIGEFYANFGPFGIFVFMYFIGWIAQAIKNTILFREYDEVEEVEEEEKDYYIDTGRSVRYIGYSIMYPLFFQWIARGNFSGNIYMTFFALLPIIVLSYIQRLGNEE